MMKLQPWLPAFAWMVVIFLFSSQPHSGAVTEQYLGAMNIPIRKAAHVLEYAILFVLMKPACARTWARQSGFASLIAFAFTVLYAATDEWHQSFVPGRSSQMGDIIVDGLGAGLGLAAVILDEFLQLSPALRSFCSKTRS